MRSFEITKKKYLSILFNTSVFRTVHIMTIFLGSIIGLTTPAIYFGILLLIWSVFLMIHNFLLPKHFLKINTPKLILIALLLASMLLTTFLRIQDNFISNIFAIYYILEYICLFYSMHTEKNIKSIKREMLFIFKLIIYISSFFAVVGLILLFFKVSIPFYNRWGEGYYILGIYANRLAGVYLNPNGLGQISVIALVCCHIVLKENRSSVYTRKIIPTWMAVACITLNLLSLILSDSNASFLFIIVYVSVLIFSALLQGYKNEGISPLTRKIIFVFFVCLILTVVCYLTRSLCQRFFNGMINSLYSQSMDFTDNKNVAMPGDVIGRKGSHDISSGRLTLIKQGLELFLNFPVFGIGRANIPEYGKRCLVNGLIYPDLHNGYLTILVSYGVIGFILFFSIALIMLAKIYQFLFRKDRHQRYICFENFFAVIVAFGVYTLFETTIPVEVVMMHNFFWMILGYANAYTKDYMKRQFNRLYQQKVQRNWIEKFFVEEIDLDEDV